MSLGLSRRKRKFDEQAVICNPSFVVVFRNRSSCCNEMDSAVRQTLPNNNNNNKRHTLFYSLAFFQSLAFYSSSVFGIGGPEWVVERLLMLQLCPPEAEGQAGSSAVTNWKNILQREDAEFSCAIRLLRSGDRMGPVERQICVYLYIHISVWFYISRSCVSMIRHPLFPIFSL
jgi:hypothetical protein